LDKHRGDKIRSQLGIRNLDKKYTKGRKIGWNIYRGCHEKELQRNFCIIHQQNNMILEDQKKMARWLNISVWNRLTRSSLSDDDDEERK
jgi:hypothetical protein